MSSDRIEIIKELRALEKFCAFPPSLTGEERERFLKDYLADVEDHPLSAITKACAEWRQSGSTKFPTSGQLLPIIRRHMPVEHAERIADWRTLSEDEYAALSLRDKIRHQEILAHEAASKAGPMFRNTSQGPRFSGLHLTPEEMPAAYNRWQEIARGHRQEAKRLRKYLRQPAMSAAAE